MSCIACETERAGEASPDSESIVHVLGLIMSHPTMLARVLETLCERHLSHVDAVAEAARKVAADAKKKGLEG